MLELNRRCVLDKDNTISCFQTNFQPIFELFIPSAPTQESVLTPIIRTDKVFPRENEENNTALGLHLIIKH